MTCFLTPLHPCLHRHLVAQTDYPLRLRELVEGLKSNQTPLFELYDFTTPDKFGGCEDDFINAAHIGAANADQLLRQLLATPLAAQAS